MPPVLVTKYRGARRPGSGIRDSSGGNVFQTWNNTLYSPKAVWGKQKGMDPEDPKKPSGCTTFEDWQQAGQDRGSTLKDLPSSEEIVAMGKAVLLL
eukprot:COSAG01_NODE_6206_length_3796_cov_1.330268_5_plen_96_part_00